MLNISMKIYTFFLFQNNIYALQKKHLKKNRKTILEKNVGNKMAQCFGKSACCTGSVTSDPGNWLESCPDLNEFTFMRTRTHACTRAHSSKF